MAALTGFNGAAARMRRKRVPGFLWKLRELGGGLRGVEDGGDQSVGGGRRNA